MEKQFHPKQHFHLSTKFVTIQDGSRIYYDFKRKTISFRKKKRVRKLNKQKKQKIANNVNGVNQEFGFQQIDFTNKNDKKLQSIIQYQKDAISMALENSKLELKNLEDKKSYIQDQPQKQSRQQQLENPEQQSHIFALQDYESILNQATQQNSIILKGQEMLNRQENRAELYAKQIYEQQDEISQNQTRISVLHQKQIDNEEKTEQYKKSFILAEQRYKDTENKTKEQEQKIIDMKIQNDQNEQKNIEIVNEINEIQKKLEIEQEEFELYKKTTQEKIDEQNEIQYLKNEISEKIHNYDYKRIAKIHDYFVTAPFKKTSVTIDEYKKLMLYNQDLPQIQIDQQEYIRQLTKGKIPKNDEQPPIFQLKNRKKYRDMYSYEDEEMKKKIKESNYPDYINEDSRIQNINQIIMTNDMEYVYERIKRINELKIKNPKQKFQQEYDIDQFENEGIGLKIAKQKHFYKKIDKMFPKGINAIQINEIMPKSIKSFLGVFLRDYKSIKISIIEKKFPSVISLIMNQITNINDKQDPHHFTAIFINFNTYQLYFFDSENDKICLQNGLNMIQKIITLYQKNDMLDKNRLFKLQYQQKRTQFDNNLCGFHCVFFIRQMSENNKKLAYQQNICFSEPLIKHLISQL